MVDNQIWKYYDNINCSKNIRLIATLYKAVLQRENYFQFNSPTAFGNPQYNYYCACVNDILQAADIEEKCNGDQIIFKKDG